MVSCFLLHLLHFYIHLFVHVIMNRHGHDNIRIGIVWVQTGHSTCTCTATLLVEHGKDNLAFVLLRVVNVFDLLVELLPDLFVENFQFPVSCHRHRPSAIDVNCVPLSF